MLKNHCDYCEEVAERGYLVTLTRLLPTKAPSMLSAIHCICEECSEVVTIETVKEREQEIKDGEVATA